MARRSISGTLAILILIGEAKGNQENRPLASPQASCSDKLSTAFWAHLES